LLRCAVLGIGRCGERKFWAHDLQQKWRDRVRRPAVSGKTVLQLCLDEGVSRTHFYQWRQRMAKPTVDFVPIQVSRMVRAQDSDSTTRHGLKLEEGQLQWSGAALPDPQWLTRLLKALS